VQLLQRKKYYLWFKNIEALGELHFLPPRSIFVEMLLMEL
jgi:hypothetical protein